MSDPLAVRIWSRLQAQDRAWLRDLVRLAGPQARVALVGGAVRDALLGEPPLDLDVVLDSGDVQSLAQATGLPFIYHPEFQNATVTLPDGRYVDLVRSRRESYPVAGQNPVPEPGTLEDDLWRRDFTVNALALVLSDDPPTLLDISGGLRDLNAATLRPLNARSFHEDASRLVRGARLAARLDLAPHAELLRQVPDALALADRTPRLWAELKLLLLEPRPGQAARLLTEWGAGELLPDIGLLEALDEKRNGGLPVTPQMYAAALLHAAQQHHALGPDALAELLGLGEKPAALLSRALSGSYYAPGTPERLLRELLRPESYEPLTGKDVLALGVPPGKAVGEALEHLARLRQAGEVRSQAQERDALRKYLSTVKDDS